MLLLLLMMMIMGRPMSRLVRLLLLPPLGNGLQSVCLSSSPFIVLASLVEGVTVVA